MNGVSVVKTNKPFVNQSMKFKKRKRSKGAHSREGAFLELDGEFVGLNGWGRNHEQRFEFFPGANYRMLFRTMFAAGLRIQEACHLKVVDLESDHGVIRVFGKGGRE